MAWCLDIPGYVTGLIVQRGCQAGWSIEQFLTQRPDLMQDLSALVLDPVSEEQEDEA